MPCGATARVPRQRRRSDSRPGPGLLQKTGCDRRERCHSSL